MKTASSIEQSSHRLPILQGVLPIVGSQIPVDVVAGVTLAALAIPEVMGYTQIAGMPVVTGLYTMLIPMALYSFFGSSRHLVVSADSATAAILAAGLTGIATAETPQYVALAGMLALMAAAMLIMAQLVRLGFLADFLSRTVLIGFLTGVGIQVSVSQIAGMLDIPSGASGPISKLVTDLQQLSHMNLLSLGIAVAVLVLILGARRINKKIPGALIAVIGALVASYWFDLQLYGVTVLGPVPSGLPQIALPTVNLDWNLTAQLLPTAFAMGVVILAQSAATSRAYATRYREPFSENVDLVGLGLANVGAGLTGTFVVNGSPTKTQMVDGAGGRSQFAHLTASVIVLVVLRFLTGPLSYLPNSVLAAIVFLVGVDLVDIKGMRTILAQRPVEFWVALMTAVVVVFIGIEQGIVLAILLSILVHTRHGYKPKNVVLKEQAGHVYPVPVSSPTQTLPGLVVYRFSHSMYFANAEQLSQEVLKLANIEGEPLACLCIDMVAVDDVDFSAAATLHELYNELQTRSIRLAFVETSDKVRKQLDLSGITALVGPEAYYPRMHNILNAYRNKAGAS